MRRELVQDRLDDRPSPSVSETPTIRQSDWMTYPCDRHPVVRRSTPSEFYPINETHRRVRITTRDVCLPSKMTRDLGVASLRILQLSEINERQ